MTERSNKTGRLRARHWAGLGTVALLAALLAAGWWITQQRVWTDHADLRISDEAAQVRRVVWTPAERLEGPFKSDDAEYEPALSPDERRLFFVRGRPGGDADLYVAERADDGTWGEPQPLSEINSDADELGPRLTPDGRWLLFYSNRPGGHGRYDLWAAPRRGSGWGEPRNLGPEVNSTFNEFSPAPSPDGRQLYFSSDRRAARRADPDEAWEATIRAQFHQDYDIYAAPMEPAPADDAQRAPRLADANPVDALNTPHREGAVAFSPAGDFLYFTSNRPGGQGGFDLYRAHLLDGRIRFVENLGPEVNTPANETDPRPTQTGFRLYFSSDRPRVDTADQFKPEDSAADGATAQAAPATPQPPPRSYDLFTATSREVWGEREHGLPQLGWNWWVLAALLALLAAWLLFLGMPTDRQLSLLQKCLAIALAIHLLLLLLFSAIPVVTEIIETMQEEAGEQMAVNLEIARQVEMQVAARSQMTDIPSPEPEAPSASGPATTTARPMHTADAPRPVDVELPRRSPRANQMQVRLRAPQREPEPGETQPQPRTQPTQPTAEVEPTFQTGRVRQPERDARAEARQPVRNPASRAQARVQPSRARTVKVDADRSQPQRQSLASAPDVPDRPDEPVETTAEARAAPMRDAVRTPALQADRVTATSEAAPSSDAEPAVTRPRVRAAAPPTEAREADVRLPEARQTPRSLALDTAVANPSDADSPPDPVEARAPTDQAPLSVALDAPQAVAASPEADPAAETPESVERLNDRPAARDEVGRPASTAADVAAASAARQSQARALAVADPTETMLPTEPLAVRDDADAEPIDAALPFAGQRATTAEAAPTSPTAQPVKARTRPARRADARATPDTAADDVPRAEAAPPLALASAAAIPTPDRPGPGSAEMVKLNPTRSGLDAPVGPTAQTSPRSLAHRAFEQRRKLLRKHGGNEQSETAVARALAYLARQQEPDGRWTYVQGNRQPGERDEHHHDIALTALATLCYLGADHTPDKPGPYQQAVARGIDWLQPRVDKLINRFKSGHNPGSRHRNMYDLGIAAIALAEAAAMTGNPQLRDAAHRAAAFIVQAQHEHAGGWRYRPNDTGDTSVVGWQIMAIVSAQRTGFDIPEPTRKRALKYLDSVAKGPADALAAYQPNRNYEPAMAAEALFSRFLLDAPPEDKALRHAQRYFLKHKPGGKDDLYYYYYASLALMQRQDDAWDQWNDAVRERLVERQLDDGPHAGSWDHRPTEWGSRGGRIYTTAMACLTLEVYYRYLPMLKE